MDHVITPEMVDHSVDIANLALGNHDLIVEIIQENPPLVATSLLQPTWDITLRRPTQEEREAGVRVVTKVGA